MRSPKPNIATGNKGYCSTRYPYRAIMNSTEISDLVDSGRVPRCTAPTEEPDFHATFRADEASKISLKLVLAVLARRT